MQKPKPKSKAGRKPKNGKAAMTSAERQKAYRDRKRQSVAAYTDFSYPLLEEDAVRLGFRNGEAMKGMIARYQVDKAHRAVFEIGSSLADMQPLKDESERKELWGIIEKVRGLHSYLSPVQSQWQPIREEVAEAVRKGAFPHRLRK